MRSQVASSLALEEDAVVRLADAERETEWNLHTEVKVVIQMVVNRSIAKVFQRSALQDAVERAVQKLLAEPLVANDVVKGKIYLLAITVPVARVFKKKVEKCALAKTKNDLHRNVSIKANMGYNTKSDDKFLP